MDIQSFIYPRLYGMFSNNRILLMVKVKIKGKEYTVNEPIKPRGIRICNCKWGHMNCKCDGKGGLNESTVYRSK